MRYLEIREMLRNIWPLSPIPLGCAGIGSKGGTRDVEHIIVHIYYHRLCWTYSHHCQIADKNPWKRWNGELRGFRICIGWISTTRFLLWVFMCSINFSLFFWVSFPATTPRATTPHRFLFRLPRRGLPRPYGCIQANKLPRLQGYHTRATTLRTNFWVQAGYHTCG